MKSSEPKKYPDGVDILVSKVLVWDPGSKKEIEAKDPDEGKCLVLRECVNIEIEESYKKLIGTATVRFPRGTVIKKTITSDDIEKNGASEVYVERLDNGALIESRDGYAVVKPSDFKVGQRIRIYIGYYRDKGVVFNDEKERREAMEEEALSHDPDFDGYIVKCSVSSPIELKCENVASGLKKKSCPRVTINNATVQELLGSSGKYKLLDGTGLSLHPDTLGEKTSIGKIQLDKELTVADMLTEWSKYGLYCFVRYEDGKPYIKVGMPYSKKKNMSVDFDQDVKIQFDYHVANDGLDLMHVDPGYLAVSAQGFAFRNGKQIRHSITLILNPDWEGSDDTKHRKFNVLREATYNRKSMKIGAFASERSRDNVDLNSYTIVSYVSNRIGITLKDLVEEAKEYFENYSKNGVEGQLSIFGDLHIRTGQRVELIDTMEPEKNGWYRVDEVRTVFGVNGYRQVLKLPYCIAKPEEEE